MVLYTLSLIFTVHIFVYQLLATTQVHTGFPGGSVVNKESAPQCRRCGFNPWVRKIPWRRKWYPTLVFLPGKSHGQRRLVDYSPWIAIRCDLATKQSNQIHMVVYVFTERNDCLLVLILGRIMSCNLLIMATVFSQLPLYVRRISFRNNQFSIQTL